jgi:ribosomal protein L17
VAIQETKLTEMQADAADLSRRLERLFGKREALTRRRDQVHRLVGAAKWRCQQKDLVNRIFETAQKRFHARAVGSYEQLLTSITNDILPSPLRIRLDLGTHRRSGKPALDIVAVREEGSVDVCRASGGSLMNVLSTGLRISAVVKSGLRPFAAFDESECWLAPENVPAYANVLVRLADELDVQCLLISHHDPKMFRGGFVVRLDGTPESGLTAIPESPVPPEEAHANPDAFAWIRLVNFRSHVDTRIPLAPGLTCLVGGNDIGKTAVLGALGALVDGDIKDSDIRHGAREATIEIGLADGRVAHVTRSARKNVKVHWELRLASGSTLTSDGSDVPGFLVDTFKMGSIGDLSLHISQQTRPNFLLEDTSDTAFRRAEVLSVGREAVHLDRLMEAWKRLLVESQKTIASGEREDAQLELQIARLAVADDLRQEVNRVATGIREIHDEGAALEALRHVTEQIAQAAARRTHLEYQLAALTPLHEPLVLEEAAAVLEMQSTILEAQAHTAQTHARHAVLTALALPPEVAPTEGMLRLSEDLADMTHRVAVLSAQAVALDGLAEPPGLDVTVGLPQAIAALEATMSAIADLERRNAALGTFGGPPGLDAVDGMPQAIAALETAARKTATLSRWADTLAPLESPPALEPTTDLSAVIQALGEIWQRQAKLSATSAALTTTPPPDLLPTDAILNATTALRTAQAATANLAARSAALAALSEPPPLDHCVGLLDTARSLDAATRNAAVVSARSAALDALAPPPVLETAEDLGPVVRGLAEAHTEVLTRQAKASELAAKLAAAEQALAAWRDANNGVCPTCQRDGFDPVAHKHHKDTHEDTRVVVPEHT